MPLYFQGAPEKPVFIKGTTVSLLPTLLCDRFAHLLEEGMSKFVDVVLFFFDSALCRMALAYKYFFVENRIPGAKYLVYKSVRQSIIHLDLYFDTFQDYVQTAMNDLGIALPEQDIIDISTSDDNKKVFVFDILVTSLMTKTGTNLRN